MSGVPSAAVAAVSEAGNFFLFSFSFLSLGLFVFILFYLPIVCKLQLYIFKSICNIRYYAIFFVVLMTKTLLSFVLMGVDGLRDHPVDPAFHPSRSVSAFTSYPPSNY